MSFDYLAICFTYMTLAVDKMDVCGHIIINTARRERMPKKTKVTWDKRTIGKTESFIYKSECANA